MPKAGFKTFQELEELCEMAVREGKLFYEKGTKSAAMKARVAFDKIARLKVQWRKETV